MKVCVTGHRPSKLWGYDINKEEWTNLKNLFKTILYTLKATEAVTGMALGVDIVFAIAVLELKEEGFPVKLHCAIPCRGQQSKWPVESQRVYERILEQADEVTLVSDEDYKPWLMQKRNEYVVDLVDKVIAVWDGSSGGTANCVRYAEKKKKEVLWFKPQLDTVVPVINGLEVK